MPADFAPLGARLRMSVTVADLGKRGGAGDGDRTRMTSLEGYVSQRCDLRKRRGFSVRGRGQAAARSLTLRLDSDARAVLPSRICCQWTHHASL